MKEGSKVLAFVLSAILLVGLVPMSFPQQKAFAISVVPETDATNLVNALLAGGGSGIDTSTLTATLSGLSIDGSSSTGIFTNPSGTYGINNGIVFSTGDVSDYADGPNIADDTATLYDVDATAEQHALLQPITGQDFHSDVTTLTLNFDMLPGSDTVFFNVAFGSEEWPEFVGFGFNDGFGIYVNDVNIASVGGNPVNIDNPLMAAVAGTELDGVLEDESLPIPTVHTFSAPVNPTGNTIIFILGDTGDSDYDTTVFFSQLGGTVPANLTLSPTEWDYGAVETGSSASKQFIVTNGGVVATTPLLLQLTGTNADQFSIANDACTGNTLDPDATCTFDGVFEPTVLTSKSATVTVSATVGGEASADLIGSAVEPANVAPTADAGADQTVNEGDIVTLDGSASSDSDGTIDIYAWTQTAGPTVTLSDPSAAMPTFTAPIVNTDTSLTFELVVTDDDAADSTPDSVNVLVTNVPTEASLEISPVSRNYGDVQVGDTSSFTLFTVQNVGESAATNVTVEFFNGDSTHFTMQNNFCAGVSLAEGETCTVEAAFAPSSEGIKTATLQVSSTAGGSPFAELSGNGTPLPPPPNEAPTASAGDDQTVDEGTLVTLDGSASSDSDGTIDIYAWTQTAGPTVTLSDPSAAMPTFTAPEVDADTVLTFELVVTDDDAADSTPDSVNVTVQNVVPPPPENVPPTADAGEDRDVNEGAGVNLDGSASSDTDGTIATYAWTQTAGPTVVLTGANTDSPTFTAPEIDSDTTLTFQLVVTDDDAASSEPDTVDVIVRNVVVPPPENVPPTADAGTDQTVDEVTLVTLDGTASSDPDSGPSPLTYSWVQTAGPSVTLSDATAAMPSFTAPLVGAGGETLTFELTVSDGAATDTDAVDVFVSNVPTPASLEILPLTHNYGDIQVGSTSSFTLFTVQNVGESGATNVNVQFFNADSTQFVMQNNFCADVSLAEGETCTVEAGFAPDSQGVKTATLQVSSTAGGSPFAELSGNGTPTLPPAPESIQLETTVRDFKGTNEDGGHPDFEDGIASVSGIVQGTLGDDGKPVYCCPEPPFPSTTHGPEAFNQWYNNVDGVNMSTNKIITLTKVSDNPLLYEYDNSAYFPIDNELFGNTPGFSHNYHFTTEIHTQFTYEAGQTFTFSGDDDVWVFINGHLAIDLGGVHGELTDSVDLDDDAASLGIVPGNVYTLDIFHAERHTTGSNFRITTSIVLETPPEPAHLVISPIVHDFGDLQQGLTSSLGTFTITNEGESTSSPITIALGNTNADQFNIQNDECTGVELAGGNSCTVDAQFAPTATGLKTTTLEASATEGGTASASLAGTGTELPPPPNNAPAANAGDDQTVDENTEVTLDGSASSDSDGTIASYAWTQTAGPTVTLSDPSAAMPTFTAPEVDTGTVLTFELIVTDNDATTSTPDSVNVTVQNVVPPPPENVPPTADAGTDQTVDEVTLVTLDGTASSDPDSGPSPLTYSWVQTAGPSVTLSDATAAMPTFTAPDVGTGGEVLTFELTVSDGAATDVDTVTVQVNDVSPPPSSPADAIRALIIKADGMGANPSMLKQAPELLEDENPSNDAAACGKLGAFINHVEAQSGKKLSHEQAEELIADARAIEEQLGC